jgi:hypothetical protein
LVLRRREFRIVLFVASECASRIRQEQRRQGLTMIDGTIRSRSSLRQIVFVAIALASYVLYSAAVLALHLDRTSQWDNERDSMAVAVSHLAYRAPLGAVAINVERYFMQLAVDSAGRRLQATRIFANGPEEALAATAGGSMPSGGFRMFAMDGSGAGLPMFYTIAMGMFGAHVSSLVAFYLIAVGISVLAFAWRYRDERQFVVVLYFLISSVMLLTPLFSSEFNANTAPIGGYRLCTLVAILPALHLYFEILEPSDHARRKLEISNLLALFVQGALFFAIILTRSSAGYLLIALMLVLVLRLYRGKIKGTLRSPLGYKLASWGAPLVFWVAIVVVAMPQYVKEGRVFGIFWHRAFVSLSLHPQWPFGDMSEVYDCKKVFSEGLGPQGSDHNGHCVWFAYPPNATRPLGEVSDGLYGGEYETAMRRAYFYVLFHYPKQFFEVHAYTKSALIWRVLTGTWPSLVQHDDAPDAKLLFAIVGAQLLLLISFIITAAAGLKAVGREMLIFPAAFVASLLPLYVAWAMQWTSADTIFLFYCCMALVPSLFLQWAASFVFARWTRAPVHPKLIVSADASEPRHVSL